MITAQATAYSNERNAISILGNRLTDSVALVKALGGGWNSTDLPAPAETANASKESETKE